MTEQIKSENLAIGYNKVLMEQICLSVKAGEILTLIGPNGCGKSTLLKTLTGQIKKKGGVIYLGGENSENLSLKDAAKKMSMVMTERIRPELMTCEEVVKTGRYPYTGALGILSADDEKIVADAMKLTNTADLAGREYMTLSDGQKQRILLAKAVCQEPEVLILDEPTSYLDIRYKLDLLQMIRQLAAEKKMAVVMSLHELEIAMRVSDTVVAMGEGKILGVGTPREIFKEDFIRKLYGIEGEDISPVGTVPWMEGNSAESGKCEPEKSALESGEAVPVKSRIGLEEKNGHGRELRLENNSNESTGPCVIMIQGTMSNAGKSIIASGLCRIFTNDGYRVAPFKSQNMALNSYVTRDGKEMGRAQVVQAECCKRLPEFFMNPILLKPTGVTGSQVIINGTVQGNMTASEYFAKKTEYIPAILEAFEKLSEDADIIVVEGAGSPVEMNLKKDDIVNMGLAKLLDAKVFLVGDIDRGGIFPQLLGTLDLLEKDERDRVKGLIVNKFRGDKSLFDSGVSFLKERGGVDVLGVVPFMNLDIDDEDSLAEKLGKSTGTENDVIDVAVIRLPYISNFTDFYPFSQVPGVGVRFVKKPEKLGNPDLLILPGSKNTIHDLKWLKAEGFDTLIQRKKDEGCAILGICGGFQMLGESVADPEGVEFQAGESKGNGPAFGDGFKGVETDGESPKSAVTEEGLKLLPVETVLGKEKKQELFKGEVLGASGIFKGLKGYMVEGYEIHMGSTEVSGELLEFTSGKTGYCCENVYGTYIHGLFDRKEILKGILEAIAKKKGVSVETDSVSDYADYKEAQYELLAKEMRNALDMKKIYEILGLSE